MDSIIGNRVILDEITGGELSLDNVMTILGKELTAPCMSLDWTHCMELYYYAMYLVNDIHGSMMNSPILKRLMDARRLIIVFIGGIATRGNTTSRKH